MRKTVMTVLFLFFIAGNLHSLSMNFVYEPFLIKQFNQARTTTSGYYQEETNLLFHQAILKFRQDWLAGPWDSQVFLESGLSISLAPVRKTWDVPAYGDFSIPVPGENYWSDHDVNSNKDSGTSKYLSEDTNLTFLPVMIGFNKKMWGKKNFELAAGFGGGVNVIYITMESRALVGGLVNIYEVHQHALIHVARVAGINLTAKYKIDSNISAFLECNGNGVSDISNYEENYQGGYGNFISGYRFDGFRYNAKLGVSWKI